MRLVWLTGRSALGSVQETVQETAWARHLGNRAQSDLPGPRGGSSGRKIMFFSFPLRLPNFRESGSHS
jgi:hypothetical protein